MSNKYLSRDGFVLFRRSLCIACAALLVAVSASSLTFVRATHVAAATSTLSVVGNHLVDNGSVIILRGVNRSGSEYACHQGWGIFDGPSDDASVAAIASWGVNAVRVPFNEDCWLGINGINPAYGGANYQAAIIGFVTRLRAHGIYVILSNQVAGPGTTVSTTILPMPDADHAPAVWSSVATAFKSDMGVIFDLYNEPHDVSWSCWANGCLVTGGYNWVTNYQAAGFKSLTAAVRNAGATNVIMIGGLGWSIDPSGWLANKPSDSQLMVSVHNYNYNGWNTPAIWDSVYAPIATQVPVTFGEMGFDGYIETIMPWDDAHGIGYLAWTWDTWGTNEALISNYNGTPTTYGQGFKNYLAGLAAQPPTVGAVSPSRGPNAGGMSVTITGTNLSGATAVKFGAAAAASFTVNSASQITATSPAGSGTVDVTVTTAGGTSAVTTSDRFTYLPAVAALPALANKAYGGYTTVTYVQNTGSAPASVAIRYADPAGNVFGTGDYVTSLAPNADWTVRQDNGNAMPAGAAGSAVVYSDQPLAVFVNEFAPGNTSDATSYTAISLPAGTGSTLFAPAIANNAYGGYTTGIGLVNLSSSVATITVTYRDGSGSVAKTQTVSNLGGGAYKALYSGDATLGLPSGFAGTATITSSAGNLAAVVNETGPGGQFSSYDAVPGGTTTLYAPAALNNAYGGYNTGMAIENTTGSAGTVTINYYDATGSATTKSYPIAANGYLGVYQGTDIPIPGAYTAKITSTVAITAIVTEVAPSLTSAKQSTSYNTFAGGSSNLHLPLVESAGTDGWSTAQGIMNTGAAATTITVTYYDAVTGVQVGTPQSLPLQPNAFWGLYQPTGGLPTGTRASAVVTTAAGGQVAVICNESNATSFMSYIGI